MMEAAVGISVFLEDKASYDRAMAGFRTRHGRVPCTWSPTWTCRRRGAESRTSTPGTKIVKYWQGQSTFVTGLTQETAGTSPTPVRHLVRSRTSPRPSRIQGRTCRAPTIGERLRHALASKAKYQPGAAASVGLAVRGQAHLGLGPITEVGYNALHNRASASPWSNTRALTERTLPRGTNNLFVAWGRDPPTATTPHERAQAVARSGVVVDGQLLGDRERLAGRT